MGSWDPPRPWGYSDFGDFVHCPEASACRNQRATGVTHPVEPGGGSWGAGRGIGVGAEDGQSGAPTIHTTSRSDALRRAGLPLRHHPRLGARVARCASIAAPPASTIGAMRSGVRPNSRMHTLWSGVGRPGVCVRRSCTCRVRRAASHPWRRAGTSSRPAHPSAPGSPAPSAPGPGCPPRWAL